MNRRISVAALGALSAALVTLPLVGTPSAVGARAPHKPAAITSVTPWAQGVNPGDIKLSWRSSGAYTTYYKVETATSEFSPYPGSVLPRKGRNWAAFRFTKRQAHLTRGTAWVNITADQLKAAGAGAPLPSGNHLYFRVYAVNAPTSRNVSWTAYPFEKIIRSRGMAPTGTTPIRVASYNVHVAGPNSDTGELLWSNRGPRIARDIVDASPGIVTLQELSPGPVSTKPLRDQAKVDDSQAAWLVKYVHNLGGTQYRLNRTSPYTWSTSGVQGARILYDSSRYTLLSDCQERNDRGQLQSTSCGFMIPMLSSDTEKLHRWASYSQFQDNATGKQFWVVSAHLDNRNVGTLAQRTAYEQLRKTEVDAIVSKLQGLAQGEPIILGMDQNTWQSIPTGYVSHGELISAGFYDAAAAVSKINFGYATENAQYDSGRVQKPTNLFAGARLDVIATYGMPGSSVFKIWHHADGLTRSDHNMVTADLKLP